MSAATLQDLANWLQPMLAALQPAARRTLAGQIARELRRQNQATMRAQTSPDGEPWEARRKRIVGSRSPRSGAARARQRTGPMMAKLRQTRYLPTTASADAATLTFAGRVLRIARVHHEGLVDHVAPGGPEHTYAARPLIGISDTTADAIRALVLAHLQAAAVGK